MTLPQQGKILKYLSAENSSENNTGIIPKG